MMNNQFNAPNLPGVQGQLPHGQMAQHVAVSPPQSSVLSSFYSHPHQQQHQQQQQHHHPPHTQQTHAHPHHTQQQLSAAVAASGGLYADPRQLQLTSSPLEKAFYTTTAAAAALGTPQQRFYTTAPGTALATSPPTGHAHPNTILITNNFASHQHQAPVQSPEQQRLTAALNQGNIRIVTSSSAAAGNPIASNFQQQPAPQHVFNLNNSKTLQHIFPQHLLQQHQQQQQQQNFHHTPELLAQHHFTTAQQHFAAAPSAQNAAANTTPLHMPQYYVANESPSIGNSKILANIPSTTTNQMQVSGGGGVGGSSAGPGAQLPTNAGNSSTVVLDRINICINNLYTDTTSSSSNSNSLASTPAQQPSPIIPAIQHKAIIESGPPLPPSSVSSSEIYESNALVIDEPDSTTTATTPHTPPTTPENTPPTASLNSANKSHGNSISTTTSNISSPSTSSSTSVSASNPGIQSSHNISTTKQNFANVAQNIEEMAQEENEEKEVVVVGRGANKVTAITSSNTGAMAPVNAPLTPPTPPSPEVKVGTHNNCTMSLSATPPPPTTPPPPPPFINGEDVFIKRQDGRFYLGTVIDGAQNQFLIRFDDKTEQWCKAEEMRKLGGAGNDSTAHSSNQAKDQAMCVACKQQQPDSKVEICERCGRGYHRKCTLETSKNSGVWLCKRCDKPMKLGSHSDDEEEEEEEVDDDDMEIEPLQVEEACLQLPYDLNSLSWDSKHRVNEQQIYCYCGKAGKFDHNMLQCWHCLNWYHIECSQKFKGSLLRGDVFFVFCCTVCNKGEEYLRRLQIDWVDLLHLIIYNLSTMKKHQNHKYHHLLKDIFPFAMEKRISLPIAKEWKSMPENEFLEKLKNTLKDNTERFVGGKEIKRDHYFFALRTNGPPFVQPIALEKDQIINDDFILNDLKLKLLPEAPENQDVQFNKSHEILNQTPTSKPKALGDKCPRDIYAFDDTSDDEIPIKIILDKAKKKTKSLENLTEMEEQKSEHKMIPSTSTLEKLDVEDDNANDAILSINNKTEDAKATIASSPKKEESNEKPITETTTAREKSSRKRKAFSLTKSYVEKQRLIDSSSDENSSSSSRCTSLDLIIPPPKNFLGQNNPFRMITPKKKSPQSSSATASGSGTAGRKSVSFGLVNGLDFSSNLAALKTTGLFPKLSSKAAGQPRTVRTIKRRLSAKDITIGPNQEVRRRRIRRQSANVEVISTTTINPIPTNYYPIHAKDLLAAAAASTTTAASLFQNTTTASISKSSISSISNSVNLLAAANNSPSSSSISPTSTEATAAKDITNAESKPIIPTHGRRLRQRPPKSSPNTSRRNSVSSNQSSASSTITNSSSSSLSSSAHAPPASSNAQQSHEDLKQTVNKYFGIVNRIESGEQFSIRAKRKLPNGQMQYLIEWGSEQQQQHPPQTHQEFSNNKLSPKEENPSQNAKETNELESEEAATTADRENTRQNATPPGEEVEMDQASV
ncbi:polycomb protein Pcl [Musca domestica]|uniref:Polycomb protein Pcl n=1 Tax=Musca domestica TaxID=7370 RepID=A0A1I8MMP1_MUSDO|nr:polycomb protein Pcl [Musca domestica]